MKQMISVYRRKDAFLMHPDSQIGERGVWLAQEPGLGLSFEASDAVLGELVLFLRPHSKQGLPPRDLRSGAPFPLSSIAGVTSWETLTRSSPVMAQVVFDSSGIKLKKCVKDGGGYSPSDDDALVLSSSAVPCEIGKALREILEEKA